MSCSQKEWKKLKKEKKRIPYQFSFHCFTDLSFKLTTGYFSQFPEFCGQTQSPRGLFYVTRPSQRLASYWPGDILLSSSSCAFSLSCFVLLLSCHNPPSNSPSSYARDAYASVLFWGCWQRMVDVDHGNLFLFFLYWEFIDNSHQSILWTHLFCMTGRLFQSLTFF